MKTLKLAAGITVLALLIGWRLYAAVSDIDPPLYESIVQAAPSLVLWVKVILVAMGAGFLVVAGYAIRNELEHAEKQEKSYHDMKQHVEKEITASVTRSVRSSFREREEELDGWQGKLEAVDKELRERDEIISMRGQNLEARRREVEADRAEVIPVRRGYEDARVQLGSLIEVTKADQAETLKILRKALQWVTLALEEPEKLIEDAKAERINCGWLEKYEKRLNGMEIRIAGTEREAEQIHEAVTITEQQPRKAVNL